MADDTLEMGRMLGYQRLKHTCSVDGCAERADYSVTRANKGLPAKYVQFGTRYVFYCPQHAPEWLTDDIRSWEQVF